MSETIPEDVMKTARAIGDAWFGAGHHDSAALAEEVALAIMAERERAATIVSGTATSNGIPIVGNYFATLAAIIRNA